MKVLQFLGVFVALIENLKTLESELNHTNCFFSSSKYEWLLTSLLLNFTPEWIM